MERKQFSRLAAADAGGAPRVLRFALSFDVLHAAVAEHLDRLSVKHPSLTVELADRTPVRARYVLHTPDWIEALDTGVDLLLGEVRLRTLPSGEVEMCLAGPPKPHIRQTSSDECRGAFAQPAGDARDQAVNELFATLEGDRDEQYQWARGLHMLTMLDFLEPLLCECPPATIAARPPAPRPPAVPLMPDKSAAIEVHVRWQATYGLAAGYSKIKDYAKAVEKEPQRFYNVRNELGLTGRKGDSGGD